MRETITLRKIQLEHLPHNKAKIDWNKCKGYISNFQYGEVKGVIEYLQYEEGRIHFLYNGQEYSMIPGDLKRVKLGSIVTLPKKEKLKKQKKIPKYIKNIKNNYLNCLKHKEDIDREDITYETELECCCPKCGTEKTYKAGTLGQIGFSCNGCSTGFSYPNRFLKCLLEQLKNKDMIRDYELEKLIEDKRYDGYISYLNIIIEMHGEQHYRQGGRGRSLKEEQSNDEYKINLAKIYGIKPENYIIIDCRYSDFEFIKGNILNSNLSNIFDLSSINWDIIDKEIAENDIMEQIISLWNKGFNNEEIRKELKIKSRDTVCKYLKIGARKGLCNYNTEEARKRSLKDTSRNIKIYCETNKKIYRSKRELHLKSEQDFGKKIGIKLINRMLENPCDKDIINIKYVEGGEMDE